jgi:hypothetical protein
MIVVNFGYNLLKDRGGNMIRFTLFITLIGLLGLTSSRLRIVTAAGFNKSTRIHFNKACGNGLTENSACGVCGYLGNGPAITTAAQCDHACIALPSGKTDKDMNIEVSAYFQDDPKLPVADSYYQPCGTTNQPGPCKIGWTRFESAEYFPSKNEMCGRVKSWNADRGTSFKIHIWEK